MLFHDTYLARSFCLFSGSNALGWPVAVLPHLSGADCICILDSSCLFTQRYISPLFHLPSSILLPSGPASHCGWSRLSLYFHLLSSPTFGPACHCGRSRLLHSPYPICTSLFSPQTPVDLHQSLTDPHILSQLISLIYYPINYHQARLVIVAGPAFYPPVTPFTVTYLPTTTP